MRAGSTRLSTQKNKGRREVSQLLESKEREGKEETEGRTAGPQEEPGSDGFVDTCQVEVRSNLGWHSIDPGGRGGSHGFGPFTRAWRGREEDGRRGCCIGAKGCRQAFGREKGGDPARSTEWAGCETG